MSSSMKQNSTVYAIVVDKIRCPHPLHLRVERAVVVNNYVRRVEVKKTKFGHRGKTEYVSRPWMKIRLTPSGVTLDIGAALVFQDRLEAFDAAINKQDQFIKKLKSLIPTDKIKRSIKRARQLRRRMKQEQCRLKKRHLLEDVVSKLGSGIPVEIPKPVKRSRVKPKGTRKFINS